MAIARGMTFATISISLNVTTTTDSLLMLLHYLSVPAASQAFFLFILNLIRATPSACRVVMRAGAVL